MAITNIFNKKKKAQMQYAKMLNGYIPVFSQFGENIYSSDIVQMCIDIIATECSKLRPNHIRIDDGMQINVKGSLNRLFKFAPNSLMTTRDFIEKVIWLLYMNYNAFVYPMYELTNDGKKIYTQLLPLNPSQVSFLQDEKGMLFVNMGFKNGENYTLPYSNLVHLRKKFSVNDIMGGGHNGQPDNQALLKVLGINDTALQGVEKGIKSSLSVKGVYKIHSLIDENKQQAEIEKFEKAIENNSTGILPMDLKGEFIPIEINPKIIDKDTMEFLQNKILNWYGVSVPILSGDFNDEQYQAFYERTLEPLIISLGQAFSKTLFSDRELDVGNEIVFYPQKLLFTNTKNKTSIADILGNRGALTNNQLLEVFGYPPYEGGDERYMSLNYVDVNIANEYQMNRAKMEGTKSGQETTK